MNEQTATVVQFPHPGGEHKPPAGDMAWNVGEHRRKFLRSPGRYVDVDDQPGDADLVFWGEWEPPSRIVRHWPADGRLPRALHQPYWIRPTGNGFRQNTDPWVFGEHMLYSNCKQIVGPHRTPTSMQRLPIGSVICFGSTIDHEFCLDTALVIASAQPWTPAEIAGGDVDYAFAVCTAGSITAGCADANARLTLYRGATIDKPMHGMYSFVPALPATDDGPRFARPVIQLPGLINPTNRQSTWGSRRPLPITATRDAWQAIRHQVLAAGLVLAVHLHTPPELPTDSPIPATGRTRC